MSVVARMFCLKVQTFHYWYKYYLSDYCPDKESGKWCSEKIELADRKTGEIKEKPLYVFKPENIGTNMSIDDKAIGHDGFTILSNNDTGKIALVVESTTAEGVEQAMEKFGSNLHKIENVSMDVSSTYALVFSDLIPRAVRVIDKFHVMKYVYETVNDVRKRTVKIYRNNFQTVENERKKTKNYLPKLNFYGVCRMP